LSHGPTQKYKAIEAQNIKLISTAKSVSPRIGRRAITNAAKNFYSLAEELVPVIGFAIVLGVTISDLNDDCQTLKDLNELNNAFDIKNEDEKTVCGMKIPS
jgi:Na+/H+-dicarboxylate symporter